MCREIVFDHHNFQEKVSLKFKIMRNEKQLRWFIMILMSITGRNLAVSLERKKEKTGRIVPPLFVFPFSSKKNDWDLLRNIIVLVILLSCSLVLALMEYLLYMERVENKYTGIKKIDFNKLTRIVIHPYLVCIFSIKNPLFKHFWGKDY